MKIRNKIRKMFIFGLVLVASVGTTVSAATVKIKANKSVNGNANDGYYATGYIKCEPYHYANTRLLEESTDKIVKESGRKYGYNKVTATTGKTKSYISKKDLCAAVYYGWK